MALTLYKICSPRFALRREYEPTLSGVMPGGANHPVAAPSYAWEARC